MHSAWLKVTLSFCDLFCYKSLKRVKKTVLCGNISLSDPFNIRYGLWLHWRYQCILLILHGGKPTLNFQPKTTSFTQTNQSCLFIQARQVYVFTIYLYFTIQQVRFMYSIMLCLCLHTIHLLFNSSRLVYVFRRVRFMFPSYTYILQFNKSGLCP